MTGTVPGGDMGRRKRLMPGAAAVCCVALSGGAAGAVPLVFDSPTAAPTGSSSLGPLIETGTALFTGVGISGSMTVDARITASTIKDGTNFAETGPSSADTGYIPDYAAGSGEPSGDLGLRYEGNGINATENGVTLRIDFFDGSGAEAGTFSNAVTLAEIDLALYDVDGESFQSEFFRATKADGLASYRLGDSPQALTATDEGAQIRFDGPGQNFAEDDATGAAILHYTNTSGLTLDFGSVQTGGMDGNPVFSGIDGDLSLFDGAEDDFEAPEEVAAVPLPATLPLVLSGLGGLAMFGRRRRRRA